MIAIMSDAWLETFWGTSAREQQVAAGEILFRAGDPVRFLYRVSGGEMRLVRPLARGVSLTIQRALIGAILAEASLFAESYHCEAFAAKPSRLRAASVGLIKTRLMADRDLALSWAKHLALEVQRARSHAETLALRTVAERLEAWMAESGQDLPAKGQGRQVAAEIGVTPEALYRELARRRSFPMSGARHAHHVSTTRS